MAHWGCALARLPGNSAPLLALPPTLRPSSVPPPPTHTHLCTPAQYFRKKKTLLRHLAKCTLRHPPGDEIYRSPPPPPNDPTFVGGAGE